MPSLPAKWCLPDVTEMADTMSALLTNVSSFPGGRCGKDDAAKG